MIRSIVKKSNQRKREREQREKERELISSVTPLSRGTETERLLILELLENDTPPITIYHDLIVNYYYYTPMINSDLPSVYIRFELFDSILIPYNNSKNLVSNLYGVPSRTLLFNMECM